EQTRGAEVDGRADLYAVGVILYQMLTGRLPFAARSALEVIRMHREAEPPPLRAARPDVPECFEAVVRRARAKDPAPGYPTAAAFQQALDDLPLAPERDAPARASSSRSRAETATHEAVGAGTGGVGEGATEAFYDALVGSTLD